MRKYKSEIDEALHEGFLADFRHGKITEAELMEFEADAFIEEDTVSELVAVPQEKKSLVNVTH